MTDNILSFPIHKVQRSTAPVPTVCAQAADEFDDIIILGHKRDGGVAMITTMVDPAEILWFFEAARFGIMLGGEDD